MVSLVTGVFFVWTGDGMINPTLSWRYVHGEINGNSSLKFCLSNWVDRACPPTISLGALQGTVPFPGFMHGFTLLSQDGQGSKVALYFTSMGCGCWSIARREVNKNSPGNHSNHSKAFLRPHSKTFFFMNSTRMPKILYGILCISQIHKLCCNMLL